jgi:hypothetical protein
MLSEIFMAILLVQNRQGEKPSLFLVPSPNIGPHGEDTIGAALGKVCFSWERNRAVWVFAPAQVREKPASFWNIAHIRIWTWAAVLVLEAAIRHIPLTCLLIGLCLRAAISYYPTRRYISHKRDVDLRQSRLLLNDVLVYAVLIVTVMRLACCRLMLVPRCRRVVSVYLLLAWNILGLHGAFCKQLPINDWRARILKALIKLIVVFNCHYVLFWLNACWDLRFLIVYRELVRVEALSAEWVVRQHMGH